MLTRTWKTTQASAQTADQTALLANRNTGQSIPFSLPGSGALVESLADAPTLPKTTDTGGELPLRVVFALNSFTYGGVEEHVALLSGALSQYGYDPTVISADTAELAPLRHRLQSLNVRHVAQDLCSSGAQAQMKAARLLAQTLQDLRADLLHIQLISYYGGRVPLLAARWAGVPVVVTHHIAPRRSLTLMQRWTRRPFLRSVQWYVSVSEANLALHITRMGLPETRALHIHNGIEASKLRAELRTSGRLRGLLNLSESTPLVGCVGRLVEQKGYHWLIEAAPRILQAVPDAHFVAIGEGDLRAELEQQTARAGIADRFHWLGFRNDVTELLPDLNALAMPSEYEGLPIVLLEAMACEVPVVAHAVDGIPEAVTNGVEGFLIPRGDVAQLENRLISVLQDRDMARRMGQAGRMRVLRDFTVDRMAQRYAALYHQVLSETVPALA